MTPILEIQKLSHIYSPDTPFEHAALSNVDLTISRGEFVGLIGHTGSGKSTLVQHMNGLLKPTSGHVLFDGRDIWEDPKVHPPDPLPRRSGVPVPGISAV